MNFFFVDLCLTVQLSATRFMLYIEVLQYPLLVRPDGIKLQMNGAFKLVDNLCRLNLFYYFPFIKEYLNAHFLHINIW